MKTSTIFSYFFTLATFFCATLLYSQERTDSDQDGFLGAVKSVKLISFEAVTEGDKISRGASGGHQIRSYNESGQLLEVIDYMPDGTVRRNKKYTYSDKGLLVEGVDFINGQLIKKELYTYDKKGNLLEKVKYNGEGEIDSKNTYSYNKAGKQIEAYTYISSFGELLLEQKQTSSYDDKGNMIKIDYAGPEGNSYGSTEMKYDDKGNMIEDQNLGEDGSVRVKQRYIYNADNVLIERNTIGANDNIERQAILNKRGQLLKLEHYDEEGNVTRKSGSLYDDYGNPTAELRYDQEGTESKDVEYTYLYDNQHNWTEQIATQRGQVAYIMAREIDYY
jgi:hypothetical protein